MYEELSGEPPEWLSPVEAGLWQAFRNGSMFDLRTGDPVRDDPHGTEPWGHDREIRARVVCVLLLSCPPPLRGRVSSLKLAGARVTGLLDLAGGTVAPYVELVGCRFEQEVLLPEARFTTLRLVDCALPRLEAARLHTEGDLHLPRCQVAHGARLTDAHIGTDLLLNQAVLRADRRGSCLLGDGLSVGQDLQAELLEAEGEVSLRGAQIGVSLSLRGARLSHPYGRRALNAPQLTVERTLYLTPAAVLDPPVTGGSTPARGARVRGFECRGGVRLDDGRFGDAVDLEQAEFVLDNDQEVSLRRVQVPELRYLARRVERGRVVLSGARVGTLVDRAASWPRAGLLAMGGFSYESLVPVGAFPLSARLAWVAAAEPEYRPEGYERLAAVLRASGEDPEARLVLLAKERARRATLPPAVRLWGYVQDVTVAYGYRPGRAALWMGVLWAASSLFFSWEPPSPLRAGEHPQWNPALFALDLLVPVVDLGQQGFWRMQGAAQWAAAGLVALGWTLATTVAAGATRALRKG
ncbi:oxidoreductase [Streptomyces sp. NPDC004959]|uniref:hypothetical protein n=1 Tax=unclassified Streptomyces TaxID=2593676 RepID=UPI0004CB697C|nr:hypothetical protein [Streptomyces sp. NRRL F-5630]